MGMEIAKTLLNHPALIELIDHPGFSTKPQKRSRALRYLAHHSEVRTSIQRRSEGTTACFSDHQRPTLIRA